MRVRAEQGRTGGGLFTGDGYLAGVCDFANPQQNRGLYATPASIHRLLDRNNLAFLYDKPRVAETQLDQTIRTAETQLRAGDPEDVDRALGI